MSCKDRTVVVHSTYYSQYNTLNYRVAKYHNHCNKFTHCTYTSWSKVANSTIHGTLLRCSSCEPAISWLPNLCMGTPRICKSYCVGTFC